FKLIPLARKFDVMIMGYALCTVFMLIAIIKYRMLDATEAARDYVVDELSEGIIVVDTEDKISYFNKPAQKLFPELDDPEKSALLAPKLLFDLEKAIRSGEPIKIGEEIFTPRANPLTEDGTKIGTLYSLSDDSEHYRYMEKLREQKQIADNANEAKSQFLANMSHEIRTPINAVLGLNEMILRECDKVKASEEAASPEVKEAFANIGEYSGNIEGAGNNLLSIINGILDISKIEAGKMDIVELEYDLRSLLKDINDMISFRAAEKGLEFAVDVDETLPGGLYGDRVRIRQVITNILTNAVKYTDNGTVRLTVSSKNADGVKEGDTLNLRVVIKDTGIGIKPEDMDKLFDKFQRFELERNSTIEGTGLGLAIAGQLVSMMGGKIKVDSKYGFGSTFTITLPQRVVSVKPVGNLKAHPDNASDGINDDARHPYRPSFTAPDALVLIVDDSKVNLMVAQALLRDTGVKTDTADGGLKAVELAARKAYDLILMDQRMPTMDGTEALNLIRRQDGGPNVRTPVICMTADAIIGARERYLSEGFDDYLSKPINSQELEQTMLKYLPKDKISNNDDGTEKP
ncbi:MAG: response regulator, partial [Lachnospiraceae bacterium]|nr:response regulator [Lachnospiraceae bacterium]